MATVRAIGTDALIEIGVLEPGDTMSAQQGAIVLLRFQNQIDAWAADRLTLSLQQQTTFTLTSGTSTVTVGPTGTVTLAARPTWVDELAYVIPGSSPAVEVPIGLMDDAAYAALSIKELSSALPIQAFYQTNLTDANGTLFFWPKVTQNVDIVVYSPQAVGIPASLNTNVIGPAGYADAFMYDLALRLCTPFGIAPPPLLPSLRERAMQTMKRPNVQPGVLGVDEALTGVGGSGYNVLSDQIQGSR